MAGYKISLFKYPRLSREEHKEFINEIEKTSSENQEQENFITLGRFDRMTIEEIGDITHSRDISTQTKSWRGDYMSILLFDIDRRKRLAIDRDDTTLGVEHLYEVDTKSSNIRDGEGEPLPVRASSTKKYSFISFTLLSFNERIAVDKGKYSEFLLAVKDRISEFIREYTKEHNLEFCILGTFGLADICILWLSDQYTYIMNILDDLQKCFVVPELHDDEKVPLFGETVTSISVNRIGDIYESSPESDSIKGKASIFVALKCGLKTSDVIPQKYRYLINSKDAKGTEAQIRTLVGEYDFMVTLSAQEAIQLLCRGGELHYASDFYQENILQTYLYLHNDYEGRKGRSLEIENPDLNCSLLPKNLNGDLHKKLNEINQEFQDLRENAKKLFPPQSFFVDELDAFYLDFRNNEASKQKVNRRQVFAEQFLTLITIANKKIKNILKDRDESNANDRISTRETHIQLDFFRELLSSFSNQIMHEAQANIGVLDSPVCQVQYNEHQDLVLNTYYSFIRQVFNLSKKFVGKEEQFSCYPLISVNSVDQIMSRDFHSPDAEKRIIYYQLPVSVMLDLPFGLFSVLHETFHYVVPYSRHDRNVLLWTLFLSEFYLDLFLNVIADTIVREKMADDNINERRIYNTIKKNIQNNILYIYQQEMFSIAKDIYEIGAEQDKSDRFKYSRYLKENMLNEVLIRSTIADQFKRYLDKSVLNGRLKDFLENCSDRKKIIASEVIDKSEKFLDKEYGETTYLALMKRSAEEIFNKLIAPFFELRSDIIMIGIAGLDLIDYLLFFIQNLKSVLVTPDSGFQSRDMLRLVAVIFYYLEKDGGYERSQFSKYEEEFVIRYIGRFISKNPQSFTENIKSCRTEAKKWFDKICVLCEEFDRNYIQYNLIFNSLLKLLGSKIRGDESGIEKEFVIEQTRGFFQKNSEIEAEFAKEILALDTTGEDYEDLFKAQCDKIRQDQFACCLGFMLSMQYYESPDAEMCAFQAKADLDILGEFKSSLNIAAEKQRKKTGQITAGQRNENYVFNVRANNIFEEILNCSLKLALEYKEQTGKKYLEKEIWFRGQNNAEYGLLPSIARKKTGNDKLFARLKDFYEEFKFKADGTPERDANCPYTSSDYLALMQHFSVETNLLDFSEDALSSLYFALEGYINNDEKKKKGKDAALYVFSPHLYNYLLHNMLDSGSRINRRQYATDRLLGRVRLAYADLQSRESIPNVSLEENERLFSMYLLGINDTPSKCSVPEMYYPIAIHTSRLNQRVKSQHGAFVAFNVFMPKCVELPTGEVVNDFKTFDLERIQMAYLRANKTAKPFLYKLIIPYEQIDTLAQTMRTMGMSKERIYPELENAGEKVKKMF